MTTCNRLSMLGIGYSINWAGNHINYIKILLFLEAFRNNGLPEELFCKAIESTFFI